MKAKTVNREYSSARSLRNTIYSTFKGTDRLVTRLLRKYGDPIAAGRNRTVFASKKVVIKVPRCEDGCMDNDWEGSVSGEIFPRTRLVYVNGIPIVFMEKVREVEGEELTNLYKTVSWVGTIDCGQVGYTRKGRLVAFDYGER